MSFEEIKYKKPSSNIDILNTSSRLISEFIAEESSKSESINNRANISLCITGIFVSIIIAISSNIFDADSFTPILVNALYICIMIQLIITIYYSIKVTLVKQVEKLSPDMINDIQSFSYIKALEYEIKWKMWQYNKFNEINMEKLYCLHRVQRNLLLSIFNLILIAFILYFKDSIIILEYECYFKSFEIFVGIIFIIFSLFSNWIFEKFSFWNK